MTDDLPPAIYVHLGIDDSVPESPVTEAMIDAEVPAVREFIGSSLSGYTLAYAEQHIRAIARHRAHRRAGAPIYTFSLDEYRDRRNARAKDADTRGER